MYAPGLDLIVTSYKTGDDLRRFGASLRANPPTVPFGLAVINVDPEIDDIQAAREVGRGLPGVIHATAWENIGYGRACNKGAAMGGREVIALFNADVEITPGALDECFEALLMNPEWAVLGPRQTNHANQLTHGGIFGPDAAPYLNEWMRYDRGQCSAVVDNAYSVAGSAYFIRRSVWQELTSCPIFQDVFPGAEGAFGTMPLFWEETTCSVHVRAHGLGNVVFLGPTKIIHEWNQSVGKYNGDRFKLGSQAIFRRFCDAHSLVHD